MMTIQSTSAMAPSIIHTNTLTRRSQCNLNLSLNYPSPNLSASQRTLIGAGHEDEGLLRP